MNKTGQNGEKARYKVLLLLVVGLAAFSSAMKELHNLQQFAMDASHLIAHVSAKFAPAQVPPVPEVPLAPQVPQVTEIQPAISVETCELKQSAPAIDLPWLSNVVQTNDRPADKKPRAVGPRPSQVIDFKSDLPQQVELQIAKLKKLPQFDFDSSQFEFRIATDADGNAFVFTDNPANQFKTKPRKHREIRITPRDREMLLKSLNRSINLRFAS